MPGRRLTDHIVEQDVADQLIITVQDEPGAGGANHWMWESPRPGASYAMGVDVSDEVTGFDAGSEGRSEK